MKIPARTALSLTLLCLTAVGGCTSHGPPADRILYRTAPGPGPSLEPAVDPFARTGAAAGQAVDARPDVPESRRIEWHRTQQAAETRYIPPYVRPDPAPIRVEVSRPAYDYVWPSLLTLGVGYGLYHGRRHHYGYYGSHGYGYGHHGYYGHW